ncbi:MAG: ABC transporter ATP-binding protein [Desulfobacteraceae bacterium]|nr:MAG: ABC transporter ATP-binding protein [Desulfobacteraceae bacterium]
MVLHHINFQAQKGEVVTIIGPNGSGKTTLLKTIPGLIHALEGYALLDQEDLSQMPAKLKAKRVAMVMQPMESIYMTVEEYVLLGRLPYFKTYQFIEDPSDIRAADKYLEYTGISHLKGESLSRISSGERQLATIAKALAQEPELLLMDEPTSHLDISHQAQILKLITDLKQQHDLTVVMVQHDLNLAGEYSDQVILLDKETQTLYKSGSPKEVITEAHIRAVYHTDVVVESNPHSGRPGVFLRKS